jgi:hypothetical protein
LICARVMVFNKSFAGRDEGLRERALWT